MDKKSVPIVKKIIKEFERAVRAELATLGKGFEEWDINISATAILEMDMKTPPTIQHGRQPLKVALKELEHLEFKGFEVNATFHRSKNYEVAQTE